MSRTLPTYRSAFSAENTKEHRSEPMADCAGVPAKERAELRHCHSKECAGYMQCCCRRLDRGVRRAKARADVEKQSQTVEEGVLDRL